MKNKKIIVGILIIFGLSLLIIVGIIFFKSNNRKSNTNEIVGIIEDSVNPELSTTVGFTYDNHYIDEVTLYAINNEGKLLKLLKINPDEYNMNGVNGISYNKGKLYLYDSTEWYSIDLNKGDGNYNLEYIPELQGYVTDFVGIYNDKLYYINSSGSFHYYDLNTKKFKVITGADYNNRTCNLKDNFKFDKINGKLYLEIDDYFDSEKCIDGNIFSYDVNTLTYELLNEPFKKLDEEEDCINLGNNSKVCDKFDDSSKTFELVTKKRKYNLEELFENKYKYYLVQMVLPNDKMIVLVSNSFTKYEYYLIDLKKISKTKISFLDSDVSYVNYKK